MLLIELETATTSLFTQPIAFLDSLWRDQTWEVKVTTYTSTFISAGLQTTLSYTHAFHTFSEVQPLEI